LIFGIPFLENKQFLPNSQDCQSFQMNNIQNFKYGKDSLGLLSCNVFFLFWIFMECNEFLITKIEMYGSGIWNESYEFVLMNDSATRK
jgi:hypothetical protein